MLQVFGATQLLILTLEIMEKSWKSVIEFLYKSSQNMMQLSSTEQRKIVEFYLLLFPNKCLL